MIRRLLAVALIVLIAAAAGIYWLLSGDGIRRALEQQASRYLEQPVAIASASARLFPRLAVQLRDVRVGEPPRLALDDVQVSTGLRALLSRRVEDAEIVVSNSRIDLPLPFAVVKDAPDAPTESEGFTVASLRAITLRDITVASRGREIVLSADSALDGSRLRLARVVAASGATTVEASGIVELEPRLDVQIEAAANRLDLDDLIALAAAFAPPAEPRRGGELPGRVAAKVTAARGTAAGVQFTQFAAALAAEGNRVSLSPVSFDLFGGRYEGALDVGMGDALALSIASRIEGLDVGDLAEFGGAAGTITGRLSGNGRFSGRGADVATVLAAARGSGTATITDGTLRGLDLVRTVVLFFGKPAGEAPASAGERFSRIAAAFTLERQVLRSESLTLESPDVDLSATGSLTIPAKALEGRAELLLSEELSAQAGTDLRRYARQGNRIVLPATVGGTLWSPRVMIDARAALERGLRNEAERRLKGLLDRLRPPGH